MRLEHDDPRLMDYVLGELDEREATEIATALEAAENTEARALVEELRGVANTTRRILHEEAGDMALSEIQRATIVHRAEKHKANGLAGPARWWRRMAWFSVAAAAGITVIATLSIPNLLRSRMIHKDTIPAEAPAPNELMPTAKPVRTGFEVHDLTRTYGTDGKAASVDVDGDGLYVEKRVRLGEKFDFTDDVSVYIEQEDDWGDLEAGSLSGQAGAATTPSTSPEPAPAVELAIESAPKESEWSEYNVGNLTGQQELPRETVQDFYGHDALNSPSVESQRPQWQWNSPDTKNTQIVGGPGSETYVKVAGVKPFLETKAEPLSTFSIDVDTAAYSNVRRFLSNGQMPPADAVRIEEMINYFAYNYPQPTNHHPFAVAVHGAPAPWDKNHRLVRIGVKGKEVSTKERPAANLVFLLDVSGSMGDANKLPLVKESMKTLLSQLTPKDKVGIVTYSGNARKVLDLTPSSEQATILRAIDSLRAGGSTNGGGGIQMAYDMAQAAYDPEGINRVIMATDGDFNVGNTTHGGLMGMIEARAKSGVFLTTLGFGMGNLKDSTLEQLANRGNGNYAYIDTHAEARKALGRQLSGTLHTIAKDVKIQVEFNPNRISHYRLLGYENRALAHRDFNDDTKDAGEIGAGHTVTALYEIIPRGASTTLGVDPLKYAETGTPELEDRPTPVPTDEWLLVKMRYKQPSGNESTKLEVPLTHVNEDLRESDPDFRFAASVAAFGQVLRNLGYRHPNNFDRILELARPATGGDPEKEAFLDMVVTAKTLNPGTVSPVGR